MADEYVKLFQYGSNMNPGRLNDKTRLDNAARPLGVARLDGHGIRFDLYSRGNGCGVSDIVKSPEEHVLGVLFDVPRHLVIAPPGQLSKMDEIEGVRLDGTGNYRRVEVVVTFNGAPVPAYTYVGTDAGRARFRSRTPDEQKVSVAYFSHLEAGAARFNLDQSYRHYLKSMAGPLRP
jgi:gamma-glutamylcyclotransferase (GGCT)/AIG2-like uncharacterized protein YtfP